MKKILILFVSLCICISLMSTTVFATRYDNCADALNYMGVFKGTTTDYGIDYELGRGATRIEALVMLIRLLGEENIALTCTSTHNFSDVPAGNWAYPYVAYAVEKGYTTGVSTESFAPNSEVNLKAYATFILRALGYSDANGDFSYNRALEKAEEIGLLISGTYGDGSAVCLRDDCVYMSLRALNTKMKNSENTLAEVLISKGVIPADSAERARQALDIADKHIIGAYKASTTIKPIDFSNYAEYDGDNIIRKMEHLSYGNIYAFYYTTYDYDEDGYLISKTQEDLCYTYERDEECKDVIYSIYDDYDTEYGFGFTDDQIDYMENFNNEDDYIEFEYEDETAIVTLGPRAKLETLEEFEIEINGVNQIIVKNSVGKTISTMNYDSNDVLISKYDESNRPVYIAETDSSGKVIKSTEYTYESSWLGNTSGADSTSTSEFVYNSDGSLSKIIWNDGTEVASFRYFGNGKLDRVLCYFSEDGGNSYKTWEQVDTRFEEDGHMRRRYAYYFENSEDFQ